MGNTMDNGEANPNLTDIPSETADRASSSREPQRDEVQQVMGAQSAKAKATKAPVVLNGTYGSVGPMTLDDEVRQASSIPAGRDEAAGSEAGRTGQGSGVSSLRMAAGRVMATVAAKVQEVIPPAGKSGSTSSVLVQEDNGSAGTVGSGYVTAGSEPRRDSRLNEDQEQADRTLFSPQQARRLQEMEREARLLYAGEEGGTGPVSPSPPLPHSASSGSDQAEAIQAEVRRQMQSYLVVQAELQQRVAVLVEENQLLRQVAVSSEVGTEVQGSQTAKGGWFSGIRKNLMGLVHQVPMKSAGVPLAIPEGWALNPPPPQGPPAAMMSTTIQPAGQNPSLLGLASPPVVPASLEAQSQRGALWHSEGSMHGWNRPLGLGLVSVPKKQGAQGAGAGSQGAQGAGAGSQGAQGAGAGNQGAQGLGAGMLQGAQGAGAGNQGAQGVGAGMLQGTQGSGAGDQSAQGLGAGLLQDVHGVGAGNQSAQGVGAGMLQGAQGAGLGLGAQQGTQGEGMGGSPPEGPTREPRVDPPRSPFEAMLSGMVQLQNVVADLAASKHGSSSGGLSSSPEVVRPGVTELVKLPPPTLEGALGFSDWLHAVKPSMSDLSDTSGECWEKVLREAREWYNNQFVPANPINRVRLKVPESSIDRDHRWSRVRHRMEHLIIQSCPDAVKSELSAARISGVMGILCRLHVVYKPGGVAERAEALRQVQHPRPADSPIDAVLRLRNWKRWMTRLSDLGGASPDAALCVQALETITSSVLKTMQSLSFRINLVRASLHLDTQPTPAKVGEYFEHLLTELEAVSRVSEVQSATGNTPKPEGNKGVRQIEAKTQSAPEAASPQKEPRGPKSGLRRVASLQRSFASGFMKARVAGVVRTASLLTIGTRFQSQTALIVAWPAAERVIGKMRVLMWQEVPLRSATTAQALQRRPSMKGSQRLRARIQA